MAKAKSKDLDEIINNMPKSQLRTITETISEELKLLNEKVSKLEKPEKEPKKSTRRSTRPAATEDGEDKDAAEV